MKRKSLFHDGTVTADTDKKRLIEIPLSDRGPPDVRLSRIR